MKHSIAHDLAPEDARAAAHEAVDHYRARLAQHHPAVTWADADHALVAFRVKGVSLEARIVLVPRAVEIELDVPWAFRLFQGAAKRALEAELRRYLSARASKQAVA